MTRVEAVDTVRWPLASASSTGGDQNQHQSATGGDWRAVPRLYVRRLCSRGPAKYETRGRERIRQVAWLIISNQTRCVQCHSVLTGAPVPFAVCPILPTEINHPYISFAHEASVLTIDQLCVRVLFSKQRITTSALSSSPSPTCAHPSRQGGRRSDSIDR